MWNRAELKNRAKEALRRNYWRAVLVGLLCIVLGSSEGLKFNLNLDDSFMQQNGIDFNFWENDSYDLEEELPIRNNEFQYPFSQEANDYYSYPNNFYEGDLFDIIYEFNDFGLPSIFGITLGLIILCITILLVAGIAVLLLRIFILNPLEVGVSRFFFKNLEKNAQIGELGFAFDVNYKNVVGIMFLRSLYSFFWTLLFVIPGIVKKYEYRMIPYLLAENPSLTQQQAFAISKQMMNGQKWRAFVLDLSFIGWHLLTGITLGLVGIFYVNPYVQLTNAGLYEELSQQNGRPAFAMQNQQTY